MTFLQLQTEHKKYDKHFKSHSREYKIWSNMKDRCDNPKCSKYHRYGGRGITHSKKWDTFGGFWEDMCNGYSNELTLDRIDNDGNYTKENCRWATKSQQNLNKEESLNISVNGVRVGIGTLAKLFGLNKQTLYSRLFSAGWDLERALLTGQKKHKFIYESE